MPNPTEKTMVRNIRHIEKSLMFLHLIARYIRHIKDNLLFMLPIEIVDYIKKKQYKFLAFHCNNEV